MTPSPTLTTTAAEPFGAPVPNIYEVIVLLLGWLVPIPSAYDAQSLNVSYQGRLWLPTHQFMRQGSVHTVYYCPSLGAYACHVCRADVAELPPWRGQTPPNVGVYANWNALLIGLAQKYTYLWSLPGVRPYGYSI